MAPVARCLVINARIPAFVSYPFKQPSTVVEKSGTGYSRVVLLGTCTCTFILSDKILATKWGQPAIVQL